MPPELTIRGVPYRSIDDVENAAKELAASMILMDDEDSEYDDVARHIGDLLSAIPDDRAQALMQLIAPNGGEDRETEGAPLVSPPEVKVTDNTVTIDGTEHPICPMCVGIGYLEAEPPQDPTAQRCNACDGYGRVYTGSRVQGKETRACPICTGDGWVHSGTADNPAPVKVAAAETPEWPGALWNVNTSRWDPPAGEPPWPEAKWNDLAGRWDQ